VTIIEAKDEGQRRCTSIYENGYLRVLHELLFSLNIAMALTSAVILGPGVFVPFVRFAGYVNQQLGRKFMNTAGGYVAYFVFVAILTASLFAILRLFRQTALMRPIVVFVAGLFAVGAAPACWFYIVHWYGWYPAESIFFILCAALYLARKWPIPAVVTVLLVAIHYGFWGLRFWEYTHNPAEVLIPAVGCFSCLTWGVYVRQPSGAS